MNQTVRDRGQKAFLLDRDGTINVDTGYVRDAAHVELLHGAAEAVRMMNEAGYHVIVISNQSGVARGLMSLADVGAVNIQINNLLMKQGAHIDQYYICPHLKNGIVPAFSIECGCRKPKPGLYQQAAREFSLDLKQCYGCGDRARDVKPLPMLGMPEEHIGVLDGEDDPGHYPNLLAFTKAMLHLP